MTEITKYVADDGTEFDDEWDCRHYEWQGDFHGKAKFQMLDVGREKLDPMDAENYSDAYYLFFPSHDAIRQCKKVWDCDMVDCYAPGFLRDPVGEIDCGLWVLDETTEEWYHLGRRIEELTELANTCMEVINNEGGDTLPF